MSSTVHAAELEPQKIYILDQETFGSMYRPKLNALNIFIYLEFIFPYYYLQRVKQSM